MPEGQFRDPQPSGQDDATKAAGFTHVIAIGGSAGSVEALGALIPLLPDTLNAPVLIAVHTTSNGSLARYVRSLTDMPAQMAADGDRLEAGRIYVIPPLMRPTFAEGRVRLQSRGESGLYRPSVDTLFIALAEAYGAGVVGVVLSGMLDDGTLGARTLHLVDARMIVQSPEDAQFSAMPRNVIAHDHPKAILSAEEIAERLVELVGTREGAA